MKKAGIRPVGVSYDSVDVLNKFSTRSKIEFPLLSDEQSKVIDLFKIRNQESNQGIPYPGTFVVDRKGVIRAKLFHDGYKTRHAIQDLIDAVKGLEEAGADQ